jgi:Trk K+ transport system NAD-binding subunit
MVGSMKILLAVSKRYARLIIDAIIDVKPKPKITILSPDEEVAILAKTLGIEYRSDLSIEKLYTSEELEEYDMAIVAMDDDQDNIVLVRTAKSMNIPIIISLLNDSSNRDLLLREGVHYIIDINEFAVNNIKSLFLTDTWIYMRFPCVANLMIAFHRVARRGILGVILKELEDIVNEINVKFMLLDRGGRVAIDSLRTIETGDVVVVLGLEKDVKNAMDKIEKIFRKHEEIFARRYAESLRTTTRGYG